MKPTVKEVIDYLSQLPPDTFVVIGTAEANDLDVEGDFVQLDAMLLHMADEDD